MRSPRITRVTDLHFSIFISLLNSLSLSLFSFSLLVSVSLLNDNDSDHWFNKLSLCLSTRVHGSWLFRCLAKRFFDTVVLGFLRTPRAT